PMVEAGECPATFPATPASRAGRPGYASVSVFGPLAPPVTAGYAARSLAKVDVEGLSPFSRSPNRPERGLIRLLAARWVRFSHPRRDNPACLPGHPGSLSPPGR